MDESFEVADGLGNGGVRVASSDDAKDCGPVALTLLRGGGGVGAPPASSLVTLIREYKGSVVPLGRGGHAAAAPALPGRVVAAAGDAWRPNGVLLPGPGHDRHEGAWLRVLLWLWSAGLLAMLFGMAASLVR